MPKWLTTREPVAICARSGFKVRYSELVEDPNFPGLWVRRQDCDVFDPYRLPPRQPEKFTLDRPRPDISINSTGYYLWDSGYKWDAEVNLTWDHN